MARQMSENQFFAGVFGAVAIGIAAVIAWSDAFVAVLIRIAILEVLPWH